MDSMANMQTGEGEEKGDVQGSSLRCISRLVPELPAIGVEASQSAGTAYTGVVEMGPRASEGAASQNGGGIEAEFLLPHPGNLPPEVGERVEELKIHTYWRFSSAMGLCDILIDLDRYFSYLYLIQMMGCEFAAEYGVLALVYTVGYLCWSPAAGVISDLLQPCILTAMATCAALLSAIYVAIIFCKPQGTSLVVIYAVRSLVHIQLSSSSWKAIKVSPWLSRWQAGTGKILVLAESQTATKPRICAGNWRHAVLAPVQMYTTVS